MPLDAPGLENALEELFAAPPPTAAQCAARWADAARAYAAGVVPPSTAVDAAAAVLETALEAAFNAPSALAAFDDACAAFAASVGLGMAPAYTATPPPAPLNVASLLTAPSETHAEAAAAFRELIDAWFRTGLATLVAPPNTVIPWS